MHRRRRNTNLNKVIDPEYEKQNIVSLILPKKNITMEMIQKAAPKELDAKAINYIKSILSSVKPHSIIKIQKIKEDETKSGKGLKILK